MHEVNQWEQYEGRYCFKTKRRKFTLRLATRISVSGKSKPYKMTCELLKMPCTTRDWKRKKWQLWCCFSAGGSGALYKINCIVEKASNVDILKQDLKTLKARSQMDVPRCSVITSLPFLRRHSEMD